MKRILVFRTGQLGDSLVAVPALHAIRQQYPGTQVYHLYDTHLGKGYVMSRSLLEGSGLIDGFIQYSVGYSFTEKVWAAVGKLALLLRLRRLKLDLVIHLEPGMKTPQQRQRDHLFFQLSGVQEQKSCSIYREAVDRKQGPMVEHESDFYLRALGAQGISVPQAGYGCMGLGLGEPEDVELKAWLSSKGLKRLAQKSIAVGVGSKMQSKLWPTGRYQTVIRKLMETYQVEPVFFGGPGDAPIAEKLIQDLGVGLNASGELSLRGSARALQDCLFYLGNDTGTMHLAVAAGLKCVAIFSARDVPGKWYPYGDLHAVHRVAVDCQGCMLYECHEQKRKCLTQISVDEVYGSCVALLEACKSDTKDIDVASKS